MNLMVFGLFVFELASLPFDKEQRQSQWRWAKNEPTGAPPALQFVGQGEDGLSLTGILYPELTGGTPSLEMLRTMAIRVNRIC